MTAFDTRYYQKFSRSAEFYLRAGKVFPSGVNHDGKYMKPFPLSFSHGKGGLKWDVDGHEVVDFVMGHGALILGHAHPVLMRAVEQQVAKGTHLAGNNAAELMWGEQVSHMVPSAERVRFVQSGTEATMLALRLARAYTDRTRFLRFHGHFHGWHDYVLLGNRTPFNRPTSAGIPEATLETATALPAHDLALVERELMRGDVAAVILEPGGGTQGKLPADPEWVRGLRELTTTSGTMLIFDEVVSGFRASPGGVQQRIGVVPDITTLAKALSGGLPGGAVCGRAAVMNRLAFEADYKVAHPGTFNANPLAAAAGVASLDLLETGEPQARADKLAQQLREGMEQVLTHHGVKGRVYGSDSTFHLYLGEDDHTPEGLLAGGAKAARQLRAHLLYHGVDLLGPHGWVSSEHTPEQIDRAVSALDATLHELTESKCTKGATA